MLDLGLQFDYRGYKSGGKRGARACVSSPLQSCCGLRMCGPHANVSREACLSLGNPDLTSLPTYDWQTYWLCIWYSGRQAGTTWLQPMCYMPSPILKLPEAHHRMSPLAHLQGGGRHCRERQVLCSVSGHSRLLSETRDRDQPDAATHSTVLPRVA